MISNGAILTYTGTWYAALFSSSADVVANVAAKMTGAGLLVRSNKITQSFGAVAGGIIGLGGNTFTVVLQIQVENGMGFNSPNDVISIIRHFVNDETGQFPSADAVPYVQATPGGSPNPTGQPDTTKDTSGGTPKCLAGDSHDTTGSFNISCWWGNLTSKGLSVVGVLALLIVAGVGIFVFYGPQRVRVTT